MTNDSMIELIKALKEKNLNVSKTKTKMLLNFDECQLDLLLKLLKTKFVDQRNINYIIGEISKMDYVGYLGSNFNGPLYYTPNNDELNDKFLKCLLYWCKTDFISATSCLDKLETILTDDIEFLSRPLVIDVLSNKTLYDNNKLMEILNVYGYACYIYNNITIPESEYNGILESLNSYFIDPAILNIGMKECNEAYVDYLIILGIDIDKLEKYSIEYIDSLHNMMTDLIDNKKLYVNISKLANAFDKVEDIKTLHSLLMKIGVYDYSAYFDGITKCINNCDQNGYNLVDIASSLFDNCENDNQSYAKDCFNTIVLAINEKCMRINGFDKLELTYIKPLIDSINVNYLFPNEVNSISKYLYNVILKVNNHEDVLKFAKIMDMAINSAFNRTQDFGHEFTVLDTIFDGDFGFYTIKKANVLSKKSIFNIVKNSKDSLDKIYNACNINLYENKDVILLSNPKFIKSEFFKTKYISLINYIRIIILKNDLDSKLVYSIISTFDFDDPNLEMYIKSLLSNDNESLKTIYQERKKDKDSCIQNISDLVYDALAKKDDTNYENLMNILSYLETDEDLNDQTKIVYQKKIGKKKEN